MATNSKREQIILKMVSNLESIAAIQTVDRKPLTGISDLQQYATTQLPMAVVLAGLPVPEPKKSERGRSSNANKIISTLITDILVYAEDNVTPDITVSNLADDIWVAMYADITQGFRWVLDTEVKPDANVGVWDPYVAFRMLVKITYLHDKGGI